MLDFDEEVALTELLTPDQLDRLENLLSTLAGCELSLVSAPTVEEQATPVDFNLDTVGWVQGSAPAATRSAAADLAAFLTYFVTKYRWAANLHRNTTETTYQALQQQNIALRHSEKQLQVLADSLQQRVNQQVEVIQAAQQELYESARLRAVGQLAAGVAHEINNPIGFIRSNLGVARDYVAELAEALPADHRLDSTLTDFQALLQESLTGAQRIAAIVADLKTFSSIDQADYSDCSVNALIEATIHLVQTNQATPLPIETRLTSLPPLHGHAARLSQAIYNVLDNAAKAIDTAGVIRVESGSDEHGQILIHVMDTGGGVPGDIQDRVFDPFFTTRPVGSGTGLGLTVARDTVQAHQGRIRLESAPGKGTRVSIVLPTGRSEP
ncbi:sensor histidine kinase [Marinobacter sp. SS21]|uniref:sensor histidine kinase n=1 Tax=Marinobacter sp. SS21 TaxID=2979460 RepID=UPI00232A7A64|nr:ATP-binding protein [Marinobacter sp. SS21]MDC0663773.1 ATP-binding protein [Marinobacter sp. SS21]